METSFNRWSVCSGGRWLCTSHPGRPQASGTFLTERLLRPFRSRLGRSLCVVLRDRPRNIATDVVPSVLPGTGGRHLDTDGLPLSAWAAAGCSRQLWTQRLRRAHRPASALCYGKGRMSVLRVSLRSPCVSPCALAGLASEPRLSGVVSAFRLSCSPEGCQLGRLSTLLT